MGYISSVLKHLRSQLHIGNSLTISYRSASYQDTPNYVELLKSLWPSTFLILHHFATQNTKVLSSPPHPHFFGGEKKADNELHIAFPNILNNKWFTPNNHHNSVGSFVAEWCKCLEEVAACFSTILYLFILSYNDFILLKNTYEKSQTSTKFWGPSGQRKNKILGVKYHFEDLDEDGRIILI